MSKAQIPVLSDLWKAYSRIYPYVNQTPVLTSSTINKFTQANLFFKCENFQKVGAFKFRGACNAMMMLDDDDLSKGLATHSSGNHAAAIALAAKMRNVPAYIVMPNNAPKLKINAVRDYGAEIIFCEPTLAARESTLDQVVKETGAHFVHAYDDYR
jgi:threonine dehydratase